MLILFLLLGCVALNLAVALGIWIYVYVQYRQWMWQDFRRDPLIITLCNIYLYLVVLKTVALYPVYLFLTFGRCALSGWTRGWRYYRSVQPTTVLIDGWAL